MFSKIHILVFSHICTIFHIFHGINKVTSPTQPLVLRLINSINGKTRAFNYFMYLASRMYILSKTSTNLNGVRREPFGKNNITK